MAMTVIKFQRAVEERRRGRQRGALELPRGDAAVAHAASVCSAGGSVTDGPLIT